MKDVFHLHDALRAELEDALIAQGCVVSALNRSSLALRAALTAIATMPLPEQDNMLSASMRKVATDAIASDNLGGRSA